MLIAAIATIFLISVLGLLLAYWLSSKERMKLQRARDILRKNIEHLDTSGSIQELINSCKFEISSYQGMLATIKILIESLRLYDFIPASRVRMKYLMSADLKNYENILEKIEPYSYDLIEGLFSIGDKEIWERECKNGSIPSKEEELIELILEMTVGDFLEFFAPLAKQEKLQNSRLRPDI